MCRAIAVGLLAVAVAVLAVGPGGRAEGGQDEGGGDGAAGAADARFDTRARVAPVRRRGAEAPDRPARSLRGAGEGARATRRMSGMVEENAGMVRERLGEFRDAFLALPVTLARSRHEARRSRRSVDAAACRRVDRRDAADRMGRRSASTIARSGITAGDSRRRTRRRSPRALFGWASGLALDLVGILVFALAALAIFLALWQGHGLRRIAILELLIAVVAVRVTWLFARFLLASRRGEGAPAAVRRSSRAAAAPVRRGARRALGRQQLPARGHGGRGRRTQPRSISFPSSLRSSALPSCCGRCGRCARRSRR